MTTPTLDRYAAELRAQGYSERTIEARVDAPKWAAAWADVDPHELTRDDVLGWLGAKQRAVNTRLKYLLWVRQWCEWAGLPDATTGIRRPRAPMGVPRPVSEADLRAMIEAAYPGREQCWVLLGAFCGLRAHESAAVSLEDLEAVAGGEHILRVVGKGGQLAVVPCPPVVVDALRAAGASSSAGASGRLWPTASSQAVQAVIRQVAARAGVACSSHQLRHRYGTAMYGSSLDLLMTQQAMRHQSPMTTAGYARVSPARAAQVARSLPGADRTGHAYLHLVPPPS